jgi:glycerol uptake facilitator-like aquaporin
LMFGPASGGHFNPVVSLADADFGGLSWRDAAAFLPAQVTGCMSGAVIANLMLAGTAVSISGKHRTPAHQLSEAIATLGLIPGIFALAARPRPYAPAAVGAYIGAAYFFTSPTSFANPAITTGRMFSATSPASPPHPHRVHRRPARRRRARHCRDQGFASRHHPGQSRRRHHPPRPGHRKPGPDMKGTRHG